jgi:hypothetical protein
MRVLEQTNPRNFSDAITGWKGVKLKYNQWGLNGGPPYEMLWGPGPSRDQKGQACGFLFGGLSAAAFRLHSNLAMGAADRDRDSERRVMRGPAFSTSR